MLVFLNGRVAPLSQVGVSPEDRGFQFGDGVYEGVLARNGRLLWWDEHDRRLRRGLAALGIAVSPSSPLDGVARELLRVNQLTQDAAVYLQITRGAAPRSQAFPIPGPEPTVYMSVRAHLRAERELSSDGAAAITVPDDRWPRCDIKSLNRIPNVLAAQAARDASADLALFVRDGLAVEGTHVNLFSMRSGRLATHPRGPHILEGVTRARVIELARAAAIAVEETAIEAASLYDADEVFVTGTLTEILAVASIDGRRIGGGGAGRFTRQLQSAYRRLVAESTQ